MSIIIKIKSAMLTRAALISILVSLWSFTFAQLSEEQPNRTKEVEATSGAHTDPVHENHLCGVTHENSMLALQEISRNIQKIKASMPKGSEFWSGQRSSTSVSLQWPLKLMVESSNTSYYNLGNFLDMDPDSASILDYFCGSRTYDGHDGLDIGLLPYAWKMMEENQVAVVAAADGIIVAGGDGYYDKYCSFENGIWAGGNWIALLHADTSVTTYVHMKKNTVIPIVIGTTVNAGDILGFVGSSGRSTNPHLHFGVYINNQNQLLSDGSWDYVGADYIEPFNGSCNNMSTSWAQQKPYNEPSVIAIETHHSLPEDYADDCDTTINLYFTQSFSAGSLLYYRTWIRDFVSGEATLQIVDPLNSVLSSSLYVANEERNRRIDGVFLLGGTVGTYTVRVLFDGKTWERYFTVGCQQNYTLSGTVTTPKGYIAGNQISTSQVIENTLNMKVEYHSDGSVIFNPGFHAKPGVKVVVDHNGCTGGYY